MAERVFFRIFLYTTLSSPNFLSHEMNKFEAVVTNHLLEDPAKTLQDRIKLVCMLFVANIAWALLMDKFLGYLWPEMFAHYGSFFQSYQFFASPTPPFRYEFFMACIAAPLWEELAFRVAPYKIAQRFGKEYLIPVVILSTMLFGWGHGAGTISLMFQGFGGLFLTYAYIKSGYSYWSSVALHFTWNFGCTLLSV